MIHKFEEYPELAVLMQEYACNGRFGDWQKFTDALNNALTKAENLPISGVRLLLPSDGDLDIAAVEFCGDYYPEYDDVTKETEVFEAGAIWMRDQIEGNKA